MWSTRKAGVSLTMTPPKFSRRMAWRTRPMSRVKTPTCKPNSVASAWRSACSKSSQAMTEATGAKASSATTFISVDALVERVADDHRLGSPDEGVGEGLVDRSLAVNALDRDAHLPRVVVGPDGAALGGIGQVGVRGDDDRRGVTQLQGDLLDSGDLGDASPDGGRSGEGDLVNAGVRHHPLADGAARTHQPVHGACR